MVPQLPKKVSCHFSYRLRGTGPRETKVAIKRKTPFGLFCIDLEKKMRNDRSSF